MPAGQMVGPGPVLTARRARFAGRRLPIVAGVNPGPGPAVELPAAWLTVEAVQQMSYIGPLRAAVVAARGESMTMLDFEPYVGAATIAGALFLTTTGKLYRFQSQSALNMWSSIAAARVVREVELAEAMAPEKRAAWLAVKREKLEKMARNMVNAAARVTDGAIADALIGEADFALAKWGHYA